MISAERFNELRNRPSSIDDAQIAVTYAEIHHIILVEFAYDIDALGDDEQDELIGMVFGEQGGSDVLGRPACRAFAEFVATHANRELFGISDGLLEEWLQ